MFVWKGTTQKRTGLMVTDNRILIAPYVSRSMYILTYTGICHGQYGAVCTGAVYNILINGANIS